jgi:hypothetical protein
MAARDLRALQVVGKRIATQCLVGYGGNVKNSAKKVLLMTDIMPFGFCFPGEASFIS